ncbi:uncharacterized membrane protein YhaH (DUF805 family) [Hymenobacter luteus]|uniref:Uncharacterized membrane protein YhaH (DUF805 family) n=2 Tax=Hymenobacter TaxID=89966 RepID=A0A7W9WAI8_9BACT|nr:MULTISPECIES: DUF805 domain-containing protein [Hymenobacter]MBB4599707.1 uncharacterized membrane protein YhaH (DUF805 family) [Hymenobacter latericoloratus]MBB6057983.1 uncharacterized membrane protein YhaH (DUF805 family) [Hymenobacter luteus]
MNYFLQALKNYAIFRGRARRKEYWMFVLFNLLFAIAAMVLDNVLGTTMDGIGYGPIYLIYTLAMLVPGLAVAVRRLHDVNKSGWFMFIALIPLVGGIWLLVLMCTEGTHGDNHYGPDPKAAPLLAY